MEQKKTKKSIVENIQFHYDLKERLFSSVSLKIVIGSLEMPVEEMKAAVIQEFKRIEKFFDTQIYKPSIIKSLIGIEGNSYLSAGYEYRMEHFTTEIDCRLEYGFGIQNEKLQIPHIDLQLRMIKNFNYWLMENMLAVLDLEISKDAAKALKRMRSKFNSGQMAEPKQLLENFQLSSGDKKADNDNVLDLFLPHDPGVTANSERILTGLPDTIEELLQKNKNLFSFKKVTWRWTLMALGAGMLVYTALTIFIRWLERLK